HPVSPQPRRTAPPENCLCTYKFAAAGAVLSSAGFGRRNRLQHGIEVGSAGRIGERGRFQRVGGEIVADGEGEQVDDLLGMRPYDMGTENALRSLLDQDLEAVDRFSSLEGGEPVRRVAGT